MPLTEVVVPRRVLRDPHGTFRVLAVDHRDSLRVFLDPTAPESVPTQLLIAIKCDLVPAISPHATGVMLEPEYSIPQPIDDGRSPRRRLHRRAGVAGLPRRPGRRADIEPRLWSVEQAAASGAAAVKLLLPYHPDAPLAAAQRAVAEEVVASVPSRSGSRSRSSRSSMRHPSRRSGSGRPDPRSITSPSTGADLLKLPFPVDPDVVTDGEGRIAACRVVTERCEQPWAILSGRRRLRTLRRAGRGVDGCRAFRLHGRVRSGRGRPMPDVRRQAVIAELVSRLGVDSRPSSIPSDQPARFHHDFFDGVRAHPVRWAGVR